MDDVFENFTINILKLNKLVHKIKLAEMEEYGLKAIHVMCGYYLLKNPDGLTASEISRLAVEDKAALSRALATMREKDLVVYDPKTYSSVIVLTEQGKRFAEAVLQKADRAVEAGSADMSESERVAFYKTLGAIVDNLSSYYDELVGSK